MDVKTPTSLLELLFSGLSITTVFVVIVLGLGVVILYQFFLKYFYLKKIHDTEEDLFANIADCIYDDRIDAAIDMCRRVSSPESRMIRRGLDKMNKSSFEISISLENQCEVEVLEIKKSKFNLMIISFITLLMGLLGTGLSLMTFFMAGNGDLYSLPFYTAFVPVSLGAFLAGIGCFLQGIILSWIAEIEVDLKLKGNKFLEVISGNKTE